MIIVIAALGELSLLVGELDTKRSSGVFTGLSALVLAIFTVDIVVRIYIYRRYFCSYFGNIFDASLVGASALMLILDVVVLNEEDSGAGSAFAALRGSRAVRGVLLLLRSMRAARMFIKTGSNAPMGARLLTGQNKKRFVDLENGFDLDLAYITPSLIAMSVPASGVMSLYRNPLPQVARLLELKHHSSAGGYSLVNCCPEHPYPTDKFVSAYLQHFVVQDHTPPTMAQFCEFLNACAQWLGEGSRKELREHAPIVVHCRGGKGRTGSMCCAWLLYSRECADADAALDLFARKRTEFVDRTKGAFRHTKLQGVDTPSQRRYVQQLHRMLQAQAAYLDPADLSPADLGPAVRAVAPPRVAPPPRPRLRLSTLTLSHWFTQRPEQKLLCVVHLDGELAFSSRPQAFAELSGAELSGAEHSGGDLQFSFNLQGALVAGDVRVSVFDAVQHVRIRDAVKTALPQGRSARRDAADVAGSPQPPRPLRPQRAGKEPGCLFYFLFHSAFVDLETGVLEVPVAMMDKAFKAKRGRYNEAGVARLNFNLEADAGDEAYC